MVKCNHDYYYDVNGPLLVSGMFRQICKLCGNTDYIVEKTITPNRKPAKDAVTDLIRVYMNENGDPVSLIQLIKEQPEWAKLHINNLNRIIEELDNKLKRIKELVK